MRGMSPGFWHLQTIDIHGHVQPRWNWQDLNHKLNSNIFDSHKITMKTVWKSTFQLHRRPDSCPWPCWTGWSQEAPVNGAHNPRRNLPICQSPRKGKKKRCGCPKKTPLDCHFFLSANNSYHHWVPICSKALAASWHCGSITGLITGSKIHSRAKPSNLGPPTPQLSPSKG